APSKTTAGACSRVLSARLENFAETAALGRREREHLPDQRQVHANLAIVSQRTVTIGCHAACPPLRIICNCGLLEQPVSMAALGYNSAEVSMRRIAASLMLLAVLGFAQTLPPGVQKVTSVEGITEYAYPNGLHVLLFPDSSNPKVTINMTYLVGSRHEGYGETGMAHLLEHLMFRETAARPDVKQELTNHGANWNGTTSFDRTNYFETISATADNLHWALQMEADRMVNAKIDK